MRAKSILKYGALWGVFEITLGYLLHLLNSSLASAILIPIGVLFMWAAYKSSEKWWSIPLVSIVAAIIKLVFCTVINGFDYCNDGVFPSLAIVMEGFAFIYPIIYLEKEKKKGSFLFVFKPILLFYLAILLYMIIFKSFAAIIKWGDYNAFLAEYDIKKELIALFLDTLISSALIGIAIVLQEIFLLIMYRKPD